ncbi:MAG: hypothetical protein HYR85_15485 [Planctomycetes bacterium]|nr:hypothetical protein [Planctomycetota bacterium]MBI3846847.1 hypothetical protein [Planctomycetota bacterium]
MRFVRFVALATLALTPSLAFGQLNTILRNGAGRIVRLQADVTADNAGNGNPDADPDDGGWDLLDATSDTAHSGSASSRTTYGITSIGMALALQRGAASTNALVACLGAYSNMVSNPAIAAGPDPLFLYLMRRLTLDRTFADAAHAKWDAAIQSLGNGDVEAAGRAVKQARIDQGTPDLYPWDLCWFIISASKLANLFPGEGFELKASLLSQIVLNDLLAPTHTFDVNDATRDFYDLGIVGALLSLRVTNISPGQANLLLTRVLNRQNLDGSWGFSDAQPAGNLQSTSYAVVALRLFRANASAGVARQAGSNYLAARQGANGGFQFDVAGMEAPEADSEVLFALSLVPPTTPFAPIAAPELPEPMPIAVPLEIEIP